MLARGGQEIQVHGFYPRHCGVSCECHVTVALPLEKQPPSPSPSPTVQEAALSPEQEHLLVAPPGNRTTIPRSSRC